MNGINLTKQAINHESIRTEKKEHSSTVRTKFDQMVCSGHNMIGIGIWVLLYYSFMDVKCLVCLFQFSLPLFRSLKESLLPFRNLFSFSIGLLQFNTPDKQVMVASRYSGLSTEDTIRWRLAWVGGP
jgi:hypothetical protein